MCGYREFADTAYLIMYYEGLRRLLQADLWAALSFSLSFLECIG